MKKNTKTLETVVDHYNRGEIQEALRIGQEILHYNKKQRAINKKLELVNIVGLCHRHLGSDRDVYLALKQSIKYLHRYPNKPFTFGIYCNYLEAIINLGFCQESAEQLEHYFKYLKHIKDDFLWIQQYIKIKRLQYLLHKKMDRREEAWISLEAFHEIALFLNDQKNIELAQAELKKVEKSQGIENFESQVSHFQDWVYLKEDSLAIFGKEKKISKVYQNEPIARIIDKLLAGPLKINEFFIMATNENYNDSLHRKSLEKIIDKIRKVLSDNSIAIHQDNITLA